MTSALSDVVDFSVPIKTSGVSIVLRYPGGTSPDPDSAAARTRYPSPGTDVDDPGLLFVVRPLSLSVWMMLVVVYLVVSVVVHLAEYLSPTSVVASGGGQLTSRPTFAGSALAVLSTMTLVRAAAGLDSAAAPCSSSAAARPRSVAARLTLIAVGVFSVVVLVAYAVNMAALRLGGAVERRPPPVWWPPDDDAAGRQSLRDLVRQSGVEFVTAPAAGDVTAHLLDGSGDATAAALRRRVDELANGAPRRPLSSRWTVEASGAGPGASRTVQEALDLVVDGGVGRAFVGDSAAAAYAAARDCDLVEYRLLPETRFYAVGLSRRSRFRDPINAALLTLAERGDIHRLQNKYDSPPPAESHFRPHRMRGVDAAHCCGRSGVASLRVCLSVY